MVGSTDENEIRGRPILTTDSLYYLPGNAAHNFIHYQYRGEDQSLLYKYALSPFAGFCVNRLTPRWIAPNTITFLGLTWMITSYLVFWYYAPTLYSEKDPPSWIFVLNGLAMLVYQTLDNMDGKQARRTGSSSSLGLLFDHGCDAVNAIFGSANWIVSMALHPQHDAWMCWAIFFGPYTQFYFGTWEEYYTGKLIMPIINGPSEGLVGGAFMSFASALYGPQYWQSTTWWDQYFVPIMSKILPESLQISSRNLRNADILVIMSCVGFVQEVVIRVIKVGYKYGTGTYYKLLPWILLFSCSILMDHSLWWTMPRTSMHLAALLLVEMITAVMFCHVTGQEYHHWRWPLLPLVVGTILNVSGLLPVDDTLRQYLMQYTTALAVYMTFRFTIIIHECSSVLNVWCFDIVNKRPQVYYGDSISNNGSKIKSG